MQRNLGTIVLVLASLMSTSVYAGGNLVERFHRALPVAVGSCGLPEASILNMADVVINAVKEKSVGLSVDRTDMVEMLPVLMNIANTVKRPTTCEKIFLMYATYATQEDRFMTHAQALSYTVIRIALKAEDN